MRPGRTILQNPHTVRRPAPEDVLPETVAMVDEGQVAKISMIFNLLPDSNVPCTRHLGQGSGGGLPIWPLRLFWKPPPGSPLGLNRQGNAHECTSCVSASLSACAVCLLAGCSPDLDMGGQRGLEVARLYLGRSLRGQ